MATRLRLPVLGLLVCPASGPALGQSFLGTGPAERLTVPPSVSHPIPPSSFPGPLLSPPPPPAPKPMKNPLRSGALCAVAGAAVRPRTRMPSSCSVGVRT